jgi:hypothetical protein
LRVVVYGHDLERSLAPEARRFGIRRLAGQDQVVEPNISVTQRVTSRIAPNVIVARVQDCASDALVENLIELLQKLLFASDRCPFVMNAGQERVLNLRCERETVVLLELRPDQVKELDRALTIPTRAGWTGFVLCYRD